MARYYRRRYRTIVRAPKKRWATNVNSFSLNTSGSSTAQFATLKLATNAVQASNPTPVIVKTGNFKVQGDAYISVSQAGNFSLSLYLLYIPEGVTITDAAAGSNIISAHPEWIMGWKYVSSNYLTVGGTPDNPQSFTFSSRLKRNLNSGDSIYLLCLASAAAGLTYAVINGMVQYWTCAN